MRLGGDLYPISSGLSSLGINTSAGNVIEHSSISPFAFIIGLSGIFVDPIAGNSGVLRFNSGAGGLESSDDGGITFNRLASAANVVTSIGVLGDLDLTGNVDLASPASGFLTIQDSSDASPILFSVDFHALSGLYRFPSWGFNNAVINAISTNRAFGHPNQEYVEGHVNLNSGSGINIDVDGQNINVSVSGVDLLRVPLFYSQALTPSAFVFTISHNLGSSFPIVQVYDSSNFLVSADDVEVLSSNQVRLTFNSGFTGRVNIIAGR